MTEEGSPMKKTLTIFAVVLILCLCGCSKVSQNSVVPSEPVMSESLTTMESEESSQETDASKSSEDIDSPEESGIASETTVSVAQETKNTEQQKDRTKDETFSTNRNGTTTPSFEPVKPSPKPTETKAPENAPVTEKPKEPEVTKPTEAPKETEPPSPPAEKKTEQERPFDINYWISYAQSVAVSKGLTLESSAVDCWDNPITANPDCIYLERDITSRLNRYAKDEDITDVWIWYESVGTNKYLIYIGYA